MDNMYYDRNGQPLARTEAWARLCGNSTYTRVAEDTLSNGRWVSTVWLGLNHRFSDGPMLIFETLVFPSKNEMHELDGARYSTEAEARAGHQTMCMKWQQEDAVHD